MLAEYVVWMEMRFSRARLYKREQQCGGHVWVLEGGRIMPASLDKTCAAMEADGTIVRSDSDREEYVLWGNLTG